MPSGRVSTREVVVAPNALELPVAARTLAVVVADPPSALDVLVELRLVCGAAGAAEVVAAGAAAAEVAWAEAAAAGAVPEAAAPEAADP
jgi:hypothetical protein